MENLTKKLNMFLCGPDPHLSARNCRCSHYPVGTELTVFRFPIASSNAYSIDVTVVDQFEDHHNQAIMLSSEAMLAIGADCDCGPGRLSDVVFVVERNRNEPAVTDADENPVTVTYDCIPAAFDRKNWNGRVYDHDGLMKAIKAIKEDDTTCQK